MNLYRSTAITTNRTGEPVVRAVERDFDYIDQSLMVPARDGSWLAVDILVKTGVIYVLEMEN